MTLLSLKELIRDLETDGANDDSTVMVSIGRERYDITNVFSSYDTIVIEPNYVETMPIMKIPRRFCKQCDGRGWVGYSEYTSETCEYCY